MSPDEAYIAARRRFGNTTLTRQDVHELNSISWIEQGVQDCATRSGSSAEAAASRRLSSPRSVSASGARPPCSASSRRSCWRRCRPEEPGQLVRFYQQKPDQPDTRSVLAATHFSFLRDHSVAFEDVAAIGNYNETGLDLFAQGRAQRLRVLRVSSGYFSVLRAQPRLGREFDRRDETGTNRVVLSDATWRSFFAADPSIVGASIRLSGEPYEVAGVAAPDFEDPSGSGGGGMGPLPLARDT